jgi:hypothetical protein
MNEHSLPDDLSRWPRDSFALLGVSRNVNERDLKRAYTRLIRTYKPEHFPEQFRRIREAYETAKNRVPFHLAFETPAESPATLPSESPPPRKRSPAPLEADNLRMPDLERPAPQPPLRTVEEELDDAWNWTVEGDETRAYAHLLGLLDRYPKRSEICARLYSLLLVAPELDNRRTPCDFLVQGLRQTGGGGPCHELYRREIEDRPDEALTDRFAELLKATTQPGLLQTFVRWRWAAASRLERFNVIGDDATKLRPQLEMDQEEIWFRLLAFAADQLAWAVSPTRSYGFSECIREIAEHKHLQLRCPDVFDRLEYLEPIASGWRFMMTKYAAPVEFLNLLSQSWMRPFPTIRRDVSALLAAIDSQPFVWLKHLDGINEAAPSVLSLFGQMLDAYEQTLILETDERNAEELGVLAQRFLEEYGGWDYPVLRPRLLAFSLREFVDPDAVVRQARNQTVVTTKALLANLVKDWALRLIYRACTLFRN